MSKPSRGLLTFDHVRWGIPLRQVWITPVRYMFRYATVIMSHWTPWCHWAISYCCCFLGVIRMSKEEFENCNIPWEMSFNKYVLCHSRKFILGKYHGKCIIINVNCFILKCIYNFKNISFKYMNKIILCKKKNNIKPIVESNL